MKINLIPEPKECRVVGGEAVLSADWKIFLSEDLPDDVYAAECLSEEAKNCFEWELQIVFKKPENNFIEIKSRPQLKEHQGNSDKSDKSDQSDQSDQSDSSDFFDEQGYFLAIEEDRIIIEAPSAAGRFYGIQTLRQILRNFSSENNASGSPANLPCLRIKDYPSLKWRGISDDISRGQVSLLRDFKNIIRELAFLKKNLYQPYIEDMFIFDTDSRIGRERGAITKEEMAEMVSLAKKNHITIVPVFECLGHQDRLLSIPGNRKYAEIQDASKEPWSFSPTSEEAYQFIIKLIDEIAAAAPSPFFHIGGDESFDVGKGNSAEKVKEIGVGRVHAEFFSRLNKYISENLNRQMMVYADMILNHPEALDYMPKDCIMNDWQYFPVNKDFPTIKKLKDAGFKNIIASPGIWSWQTYYPNCSMAFTNIANFTAFAKKEKLLGCVTTSWGDGGAENLRQNNMPGYAYSAAAAWETDTPDTDQFLHRFAALYFGNSPDTTTAMQTVLKNLGWFDYLTEKYIGRMFHQTPRIRIQKPEWILNLKTLESKMRETKLLFDKHRKTVGFNREWLEIIDNVLNRNIYLSERDQTLERIAKVLDDKKSGELPADKQKEIITDIEGLLNALARIKDDYEKLWPKWNKAPKLDTNIHRLNKQLSILHGFIAQIKTGQLSVEKQPEAVWFWYPEQIIPEEFSSASRFFMREINLDNEPAEAFIKCWANGTADIYVNGEKVLDFNYYDNKNMGYNPAKSVTLKGLFKKGKNYLAVEAENMFGGAGILLDVKINCTENSKTAVTGDDKWMAAAKVESGWETREMKGPGVKSVKLLGKGLIEPWEFIEW